uniref:Prolyl endopeptidase FAP-like n=1 Tax=Diabrotica virgifera virgifera TaxID=50390 RepID=A0A6P7GAH4_DIAVI
MEAIKDNSPAQLVVWSPVGNGFVYVKENNIYYKESAKDDKTVQITSTVGYISNGVPDWVYEGIFRKEKRMN